MTVGVRRNDDVLAVGLADATVILERVAGLVRT
jgi:hypothetical protein